MLLRVVLILAPLLSPSSAFSPVSLRLSRTPLIDGNDAPTFTLGPRVPLGQRPPLREFPLSSSDSDEDDGTWTTSSSGDQLRASTGIRPSLHPTTINAISEALLMRSSTKDADEPVDVWADGVEPIQVALTAGKIASDALEKRTISCQADGDDDSIPTPEESQTVAGRIVGVIMRLRDLEEDLAIRAGTVGWVKKYNEFGTFGVLKTECEAAKKEGRETEVSEGGIKVRTIDAEREAELRDRIRDDPLFRMCRAECLLALFIRNVEVPQLKQAGQNVAGGSSIDFIDEDRKEVLFSVA